MWPTIIVGGLLSCLLYWQTGLPFIWSVAIVAALWLAGKGGTGAAGLGGLFGGIGNAIGTIWGYITQWIVATLVFMGEMMLVSRLTGITGTYMNAAFQKMGPDPRTWTSIPLPVLLMICVGFIGAGIAIVAARGNWKPAGILFGLSGALIFGIWLLPTSWDEIRPIPNSGPATPTGTQSQALADADGRLAEGIDAVKKRGVVPVVGKASWRFGFGKPDPKNGAIGGAAKGFWIWAFGPPAPPSPAGRPAPRASASPVPRATCTGNIVPVFDGIVPVTGQSLYLCPGWSNSARGDITITTPTGTVIPDGPGPVVHLGAYPEGWYLIKPVDPTVPVWVTFWSRPQ